MKRKFLIIICGLILCFGCVGCATEGSKDYNTHSKLIAIEGEKESMPVMPDMVICHHIIQKMVSYVHMTQKRK